MEAGSVVSVVVEVEEEEALADLDEKGGQLGKGDEDDEGGAYAVDGEDGGETDADGL